MPTDPTEARALAERAREIAQFYAQGTPSNYEPSILGRAFLALRVREAELEAARDTALRERDEAREALEAADKRIEHASPIVGAASILADEIVEPDSDPTWKRLERARDVVREAQATALRERDEAREAKDGAYRERDQLVAALSKLFPSHLARHPDSDETWDNDWRWIVFVDLPTGQASWHIHDSELPLFGHLPHGANAWDGHTTDEKYARLAALGGKEESGE